jgi:hypothetical protein
MIAASPNVRPIEGPSSVAHDHRACPWCRRRLEISDAAFVALYAHEHCAPRIRAREEPVDFVESAIAFALVVALGWFAILALVGPFTRWLVGAG